MSVCVEFCVLAVVEDVKDEMGVGVDMFCIEGSCNSLSSCGYNLWTAVIGLFITSNSIVRERCILLSVQNHFTHISN